MSDCCCLNFPLSPKSFLSVGLVLLWKCELWDVLQCSTETHLSRKFYSNGVRQKDKTWGANFSDRVDCCLDVADLFPCPETNLYFFIPSSVLAGKWQWQMEWPSECDNVNLLHSFIHFCSECLPGGTVTSDFGPFVLFCPIFCWKNAQINNKW